MEVLHNVRSARAEATGRASLAFLAGNGQNVFTTKLWTSGMFFWNSGQPNLPIVAEASVYSRRFQITDPRSLRRG